MIAIKPYIEYNYLYDIWVTIRSFKKKTKALVSIFSILILSGLFYKIKKILNK